MSRDSVTSGEIGAFRRDGPDSMLAGAMAIAPALKTIRGRVLSLFEQHRRLTDEEMVEHYATLWGASDYRSLGTRRNELVKQGVVGDSGDRKRSSHGVNVIIWALKGDADDGSEAAADAIGGSGTRTTGRAPKVVP